MKTFTFDARGNLSVRSEAVQIIDGVDTAVAEQHDIQAAQLAAHMPMFEADMTPAERAQAQAIIAAQAGA